MPFLARTVCGLVIGKQELEQFGLAPSLELLLVEGLGLEPAMEAEKRAKEVQPVAAKVLGLKPD